MTLGILLSTLKQDMNGLWSGGWYLPKYAEIDELTRKPLGPRALVST
jgi:hypothetical protein